MLLIEQNPFRIIGLLANASERDFVRQKGMLIRYSSIGRHTSSDFDFPFLAPIERTDLNLINQSFSKLEQGQDKIKFSLFWFINHNSFDNTAIDYLINNDKQKAIDIWEKVTNQKEVSEKNFSCINNLSTIKLISKNKNEIQEAISLKIKLINSDFFKDFILLVADQTQLKNNNSFELKFIEEILNELIKEFNTNEIIDIFNNNNDEIINFVINKIIEKPLYDIENNIKVSIENRKIDNKDKYEIGKDLIHKSKDNLLVIKSILGEHSIKYKFLADHLANEIMQCAIDFYNINLEINNPSKECLELLDFANEIVVSNHIKERILSNVEEIREYAIIAPVKKEINFILNKMEDIIAINKPDLGLLLPFPTEASNLLDLKTIRHLKTINNVIVNCKPYINVIKNTLGKQNVIYIHTSSTLVSIALDNIINIINQEKEKLNKFRNTNNLIESLKLALNISFKLLTFDMNLELSERFRKNFILLKEIATHLNIPTLTPVEQISILNIDISKVKSEDFVIHELNKLKIDRKNAENFVYLYNEIKKANNVLADIKKWKPFRFESTRNYEISVQNSKIKELENKAYELKQIDLKKIDNQLTETLKKGERKKLDKIKEIESEIAAIKKEYYIV
jgi:hypothetical protein